MTTWIHFRFPLLVCGLLWASAATVSGQEWARKMFAETDHDFGVVARGSKSEFAFELTNLYEEEVHIAEVRSSCGCTTPRVTQQTLKTWEKSGIVAVYNTRGFLGDKNATITVKFDRPFPAEVQLNVRGFIRSDLVFDPGVVRFGDVEQGAVHEQRVMVTYAGRSNWRIVDVRSANEHFEVELSKPLRQANRIKYEMLVRLREGAPAGYLQDHLTLVTDDRKVQTVALPVEGRVLAALTVSPESLVMGTVRPGESVTKKLVVRGKTPFRITEVKCDDCLKVETSDQPKKLHFVPVTFTAGEEAGTQDLRIEIQTDLGSSVITTCTANTAVE